MATSYQKKRAVRRATSDIDRLAKQYQQEIAGITGEYESQFSEYSAQAAEKESAFNVAKKAYDTKYGSYLDQLSAYNEGMTKYSSEIAGYLDKVAATQERVMELPRDKYGKIYFETNGKRIGLTELTDNAKNYGFEYVVGPYEAGFRGTSKVIAKPLMTDKEPVAPTSPGKFTEPAPEIPNIGEFDSSQFEARKTQAEQTLKREVGERRAAKLGAVSRKATRPLLGGATP
jgi:hypothetical protein